MIEEWTASMVVPNAKMIPSMIFSGQMTEAPYRKVSIYASTQPLWPTLSLGSNIP